jgi:hypothetical protein
MYSPSAGGGLYRLRRLADEMPIFIARGLKLTAAELDRLGEELRVAWAMDAAYVPMTLSPMARAPSLVSDRAAKTTERGGVERLVASITVRRDFLGDLDEIDFLPQPHRSQLIQLSRRSRFRDD